MLNLVPGSTDSKCLRGNKSRLKTKLITANLGTLFSIRTKLVRWFHNSLKAPQSCLECGALQIETGSDLNPVCCPTLVIFLGTLLVTSPEFLGTHCWGLQLGKLGNQGGSSGRDQEPFHSPGGLAEPLVHPEAAGQAALPRTSSQSSAGQQQQREN